MYPDYLVHFNKLHSKKNGQFISGDGDGDGTGDEHHRYTKSGYSTQSSSKSHTQSQPQQQIVNTQMVKLGAAGGKWVAGKAFCATKLGKQLKNGVGSEIGRMFVKSTGLDKIWKDTGFSEDIAKAKERMYEKTANKINSTYNNGGLTDSDKRKLKTAGVVAGTAAVVGAGAYGAKKIGEARTAKYNKNKLVTTSSKDKWYNQAALISNRSNSSYAPKYKEKRKYKVKKNQYLPR